MEAMIQRDFLLLLVAGFFALVVFYDSAHANPNPALSKKLSTIVPSQGGNVSVLVYDLSQNRKVFGRNEKQRLKPASILKVVTASAALAELGPEYRFQTGVWYFGKNGPTIDNLYVRGGGDPSFTTEDLWILARRIYHSGVKRVKRLALDDTYFNGAKQREGQRAYEAASSALSLNFNTITLHVCPTLPGKAASVIPDPWELTFSRDEPVLVGEIQTVSRGRSTYRIDEQRCSTADCVVKFRLAGKISANSACVEVYRSIGSPVAYFAKTLANFLEYLGVKVDRVDVNPTAIPKTARQLTSYSSRALSQIVRDMNLYSSNFISEQLLTAFGYSSKGERVRQREEGLLKIQDFLEAIGMAKSDFHIVDASGLSHDNRVTAEVILKTLLWAYHQESIGAEFVSSLPVAGRSGTLKRRKPARRGMILRAKTGTLTGVSSLAGYVNSQKGVPYAFVVIQNKTKGKRIAERLEEKVVTAIYDS
jgi:D-alanyl-D-alanine carboxypeptidase/D-alanyl-D-alanine-endopeptidase (penicillin-binding protein 4)